MDFSEVVGTAEELVSLPPAELGRRMLPFLRRWPKSQLFALMELQHCVAGDQPTAFPMGNYPANHRPEIREALGEAWAWLQSQGLIVPDDVRIGGLKLSRQALSQQSIEPEQPISETGRRERFARWEQLGVDRIKNDLLTTGGDLEIGGPQSVRDLAWEWVRAKEKTAKPSISRRTIITSTIILKCLGHSGFVNLMLEFGLPAEIGQGEGLKARATSLATYALQSPEARTIEGKLIAEAIIEKALQLYQDRGQYLNNVTSDEKRAFREALIRDGLLKDDDRKQSQEEKQLKRDQELIFKILTAIEDIPSNGIFSFDMEDIEKIGSSEEDVEYNIKQAEQMGLLEVVSRPLSGPLGIRGLTSKGHDFIDSVREKQMQHPTPSANPAPSSKVFLVHGRDENAKDKVELFLRAVGLEPIILHKRPNKGRHLLTKFREESEGASFAVVLMTPDDEGSSIGQSANKRARQNVVFELGFFIGILKTTHVAALIGSDVEKPSDFDGIAYIPFGSSGDWKNILAREMLEAGVPVDAKAVISA